MLPPSLREFRRLFPDAAACATWLERAKWPKGFECPHCHKTGDPVRLNSRPGVLACRACRQQTSLTVGTVMERAHSPLTVWFWGAYLVLTSTSGISAVQFQERLSLSRYETAFQVLRKLRAGMARSNQDMIGGRVEIDECYIGGEKTPVIGAVEVRPKKGDSAGQLRLKVVSDCTVKSLQGFILATVEPGATIITDARDGLDKIGYTHRCGSRPVIHSALSNLKAWLKDTHRGRVEPKHLQAYLDEFTFRFNRPLHGFHLLLGLK